MKSISKIEKYKEAICNGINLVDFWGPSCSPCIELNKTLEILETEYPQIKFLKINADEEIDIAVDMLVRGLPTLILIKDGKEIKRWYGNINQTELKSQLNREIS